MDLVTPSFTKVAWTNFDAEGVDEVGERGGLREAHEIQVAVRAFARDVLEDRDVEFRVEVTVDETEGG